jgi:WD40 repeat protein
VSPDTPPTGPSWYREAASFESVIHHFEQRWLAGERPPLEEFLAAARPGERDRLLVELVHVELELRLKAGESARLEEYLARFPALAAAQDVLCSLVHLEYNQRRRRNPLLDGAEYAHRFPDLPLDLQRWAGQPPATPTATPRADGPARVAVAGYEILGELGRGGMGVVYRARQLRPDRLVALKLMAGGAADEAERARFRGEAEAAARLQHPGIVQIFEVGDCAAGPFFSLEFVPGGSLARQLAATPQDPRRAAALVRALAVAVQAAHAAGVLHRDLKPANVLLTADGSPKVTDFGLARRLDDDSGRTRTGQVLGTPSYMAPEQAEGRVKAIGPAADVYGLGAILYECLTGRPPFKGASVVETLDQVRLRDPVAVRQLQPSVPRDLETVCLKCLQKEPHRRYASAQELADDLGRFLNGEPVRARPVGPVGRLARWARRNPRLAGAVTVAVLALVLTAAGAVAFAVSENGHATVQQALNQDLREQRNEAESKRRLAEANEKEADRLKFVAQQNERDATEKALEARTQAARLLLEQGANLAAQGEVTRGFLLVARALRAAPEGAEDLRGAARFHLAELARRVLPLRATLTHAHPGSGVLFSPDGKTLLTGAGAGGLQLWDVAAGQPLGPPLTHPGGVRAAAFSPDGRLVATAGDDRVVRLWLAATGKPAGPDLPHPDRVLRLAFGGDGKTLLTEDQSRVPRLWDTATWQPRGLTNQARGFVTATALSPNGKLIATASKEGSVKLVDAANGSVVRTLTPAGPVHFALFSPDCRTLLVLGQGFLQLLDVATGQERGLLRDHVAFTAVYSRAGKTLLTRGPVQCYLHDPDTGVVRGAALSHPKTGKANPSIQYADLSPDGKFAVTGSLDGGVRLWDTATASPVGPVLPHPPWLMAAGFSPDGKVLFTHRPGAMPAWDIDTGKPHGPPLQLPKGEDVRAFAPSGKVVLTDGQAGIRLRDTAEGKPIGEPLFGPDPKRGVGIMRAGWSPDEKRLYTVGGQLKVVLLWDAETGRQISELALPENVREIAFSADGKLLMTATQGRGAVRFWDADTGKLVREPLAEELRVLRTHLSPDGRYLLVHAEQGVQLLETATGKPHTPLLAHAGRVWTAQFSPDGQRFLTGIENGDVQVWDTATGQPLGKPMPHPGGTVPQNFPFLREALNPPRGILGALFSPDGTKVLTWDQLKMQLWDAATGAPVGPPVEHRNGFEAVVFSPDGRLVLTTGFYTRGELRLWEAGTWRPFADRLVHPRGNLITSAAFSPRGRFFVTVSNDGTAQLWDTAARAPVGEPIRYRADDSQDTAKTVPVLPGFRLVMDGNFDAARVVAFSHDEKQFAANGPTGARLWDLGTAERDDRALVHDANFVAAVAVAFNPRGDQLATGGRGRAELRDGRGQPTSVACPCPAAVTLAFSADGRKLATGGDREARVWDAVTGKPLTPPLVHRHLVREVAFSPDGRLLYTFCEPPLALCWDARTGRPVWSVLPPGPNESLKLTQVVGAKLLPTRLAALSPDGRRLVTAAAGSLFANLGKGTPFTKDTVIAGDSMEVQLWDAPTRQPVGGALPCGRVRQALFRPDGQVFCTLGQNVRFWDAVTGQPVGQPLGVGGARVAAFSPDGRILATGTQAGTVQLWDVATGKPVGLALQHDDPIAAIAFSADGRAFATAVQGTRDGRSVVRLWTTATRKLLREPLAHPGPVTALAFRPDGRALLVGCVDTVEPRTRAAWLWEVPAPLPGDVERLALWAEVLTGHELDAEGVARPLTEPQWAERRQRLQRLGGPPSP